MRMNWKMAIGFGLLLWVIMFAIASVFVAFNMIARTWVGILLIIVSGVAVFVLAGKARPASTAVALAYGLSWVIVGVALDAIITRRFNPGIFNEWSIWVGNLVVLLVPLLRVGKGTTAQQSNS